MADLVVPSLGVVVGALADDYDLLTLAEGKSYVGQDTNTSDVLEEALARAISGASQRLVDVCGPVVNRTFTDELHHGGDTELVLANAAWGPDAVTTIASLAEYDTAGVATALTAEDYETKPAYGFVLTQPTGTVTRRYSGADAYFASGHLNVVVTYTSGRAAQIADVPAKFKEACGVMLAHMWRQRGPQAGAFRGDLDGQPIFGVAPFALPRAVTDLLAHDIRPDRRYGIG